jgi:hypothetical protein
MHNGCFGQLVWGPHTKHMSLFFKIDLYPLLMLLAKTQFHEPMVFLGNMSSKLGLLSVNNKIPQGDGCAPSSCCLQRHNVMNQWFFLGNMSHTLGFLCVNNDIKPLGGGFFMLLAKTLS